MDRISTAVLREMYTHMLRIRRSEETIADLVETGEIRTPCHLCIGQEAVAVGVCSILNRDDYIWGGHRSHGHYLAKGGSLRDMMAEIFGKATGCSRGRGGSMHLIAKDIGILGTVPLVAATIPIAVGSALAAKMQGNGRVSISFFGDGATEEGHFHESLNLAAVYRLPIVFVCENNFYASHMQLMLRRAEDNIPKSAEAQGIPGFRIDGNDVVDVYRATRSAVARARAGEGPTLLECRTYRWRGHVGASWDMDVGVKRNDELRDWMPKDPLARLRSVLTHSGISDQEFNRIEEEVSAQVQEAVRFARESPYPDQSEVRNHVYCMEESKRS